MQIANLASDIKEKLHQINRTFLSSEKNWKNLANDIVTLKNKLIEIIEFHSEAHG